MNLSGSLYLDTKTQSKLQSNDESYMANTRDHQELEEGAFMKRRPMNFNYTNSSDDLQILKQGSLQDHLEPKDFHRQADAELEASSPLLSKIYSPFTKNKLEMPLRSLQRLSESKDLFDSPQKIQNIQINVSSTDSFDHFLNSQKFSSSLTAD